MTNPKLNNNYLLIYKIKMKKKDIEKLEKWWDYNDLVYEKYEMKLKL